MAMVSFVDATHPTQGRVVFDQWVQRARFGLHIRLGQLSEEIDKLLADKQSKAAAVLMAEYFKMAGLDAANLSGEQMVIAYARLTELNALKWLLPFQTWQPPPDDKLPPPYAYSDRYICWITFKLCDRFKWSVDYVMNELWPEQVFLLMQEIHISEYDELDERRSLTELGYSVDKTTKKATFRPVPRPGWMLPEQPKRVFRIRKDMLPVGHIVALGNGSEAVH